MENKRSTCLDVWKEVAKECSIVLVFLGLCCVALLIGLLIPPKLLTIFSAEMLLFFAFLAVLAVLYIISAVVIIVMKIKAKIHSDKNVPEKRQ